MQEHLIEFVSTLVGCAVMIYGVLLVAGAPFGKAPKWANDYAHRLIKKLTDAATWLILLPFRLLFGAIGWTFKKMLGIKGKKKKTKKK